MPIFKTNVAGPSDGHPYGFKDGAAVRLEDSALFIAVFATNVTSIAGWTVTGDTPLLVGTDVKFANPGSITAITATDDFDTGATLDFSALTGLLTIGTEAFAGQTNLTGSLVLPNSLTRIGAGWPDNETGQFSGCSGFTGSLVIPTGVTQIGDYAFYGCSGFTGTLTIPSGVTYIGWAAFQDCEFTGTLVIPNSVTMVTATAFKGTPFARVDAYVELSVVDNWEVFVGTNVTEIHARASDGTWTAGWQTVGGKWTEVIKDL